MTVKLVNLVPALEEITQADAPRTSSLMRTLYNHVGELTAATRTFAENLDQLNGHFLVLDAKLNNQRETSSHDIQVVKGSILSAVERAMTDKELAQYRKLAAEEEAARAQTKLDLANARRNLVIAIAGAVVGPVVTGLGVLLWSLLTHWR